MIAAYYGIGQPYTVIHYEVKKPSSAQTSLLIRFIKSTESDSPETDKRFYPLSLLLRIFWPLRADFLLRGSRDSDSSPSQKLHAGRTSYIKVRSERFLTIIFARTDHIHTLAQLSSEEKHKVYTTQCFK